MSPEFAAKLAVALRSGKYAQIRGRLRRDQGHCCLGVACDLIDPDGWGRNSHGYTYGGFTACMGGTLRAKVGMSTDEQDRMMEMNDSLLYDFSKIADEVERMGGIA